MKNLINPKWIFIINTLPLILLFFIYFGEYNIIKTLLQEENIHLWKIFGFTLAILGTLNLLYAVYLVYKRKLVSPIYGVLALLSYIPFLYFYGNYADRIIPFSIPLWMVPGNMIIYVGTFLMPTLAYALFVLVTHFTPEKKEQKAWINFLAAIAIPIAWYLFTQLILPFWKPVDNNFSLHTLIIFIIIGTLIFLFFLIRGVYIVGLKKANFWRKYQLAWKIPITIALPLLGLAVNNGHLFNVFGAGKSGVFGDFSGIWFYTIAILNGIFICLPDVENRLYRLLLFIGRSITFAYTFYFFLVFLPFLPLSIVAIVAVGTGFLMLTPLVLFVIHINELSKDFTYLKTFFSARLIGVISIVSFLVLPFILTGSYLKDRSVLNETLDYLYCPDYSINYSIDKTSLQKTINIVKQHKEKNGDGIFGSSIPYLSSYFNWLVLDNLTLSDTKISTIEKVFFGNTSLTLQPESFQKDKVKISKIRSTSTYDKTQNAWISWVDMEITNQSDGMEFSEYATTLDLPTGCWISNYYLYVGNKKEMGILAEKKSAMWVFSNIRNENRDPGILYYLSGNKVGFRVFPFAKKEVRKTGIEFIHKEPLKLNIDSNWVELGNVSQQQEVNNAHNVDKNVVYVSTIEKSTLTKVRRKPYYHFLVDVSKGKEKYKGDFTQRIETLLKKNLISSDNAKISFVNTYLTGASIYDNWKGNFNQQTFEGGYYLDRAIRVALINSFNSNSNSFPIIVTITDSIQKAIFDKDFADLKFTYPEMSLFYDLTAIGDLKPHSLSSYPRQQLADSSTLKFNPEVLAFPNKENPIAYLSTGNEPDIVLTNHLFTTDNISIKEKKWQSALILQAQWNSQVLHPETSKSEWLKLVRYSFISKVMTPATSYLVVENEAQKAMLKKKQEQVLSGNKSLDPGEDAQRMSEPALTLLTILAGLGIWYNEKRKKQMT